ncbi:MAG: hypothetical protein IKO68_07160 [Oscillospiraceae bacterium]|nr:hypothetical protein [Oscillospiraceae bacterium]
MKRFLAILMAALLLLTLAACGGKTSEPPAPTNAPASGGSSSATEAPAPTNAPADSGNTAAPDNGSGSGSAATDPAGSVDVDVGKNTVTITIPADFMEVEGSEEEIIAEAQEEGITDVVINDDGSVTYTMTKEKHEEMLSKMAGEIDNAIKESLEGENADPTYKSITHNADYSQFEMAVDPALYEESSGSINAMSFTMLGAYYQAYAGKENADCTVIVKNAETGEEIEQVTYDDWLQFLEELMSWFSGEGEEGGWDWEPTYSIELPEMEAVELLDEGGVKVTAVGFDTEEYYGQGIRLEIENNSDTTIYVDPVKYTVNGYSESMSLYATVAPGETASELLYLPAEDLAGYGVTEIGQVTVQLAAYDEDTYEELFRGDEVVINTSDADKDWQKAPEGNTLYDQDGILIRYLGLEESEWGSFSLKFYFENNTDKEISVSEDSFTVNGKDASAWIYATVYPGTRAVDFASIWKEDLEEDYIYSAEITFSAYDENYDTVFAGETFDLPMG